MLNTMRISRQRGLGLIELMVGMVVALIVVAGASALYLNTSQGSINTQRQFRLNQEVRGVMDIITQDVKRAGYWSQALTAASGTMNPFAVRGTNATDLYLTTVDPTQSCWLYSYDATFNTNHIANTVDGYSFYGFRINNNTIQMLPDNSGLADTSTACGDLNTWQNLTDPSAVYIQSLTLYPTYQCLNTANVATNNGTAPCSHSGDVEVRQLQIGLVAHHVKDTSIAISIQDTVTLPNNRIVP